MKNILIPTVLGHDTVNAIRTALMNAPDKGCTVILLLLEKAPDTYCASTALRQLTYHTSSAQKEILEECRTICHNSAALFKVHHQFGISAPLLKNVLEHLEAGLVILTPSFKSSIKKENYRLVRLLLKSRYPILHLNSVEVQTLSTALYIEHNTTAFTVQDMQQLLNNQFRLRIVSRTKINDGLTLHEANPIIAEAITNKQIDVLVETRRCTREGTGSTGETYTLKFGVPVLSIYEEDIKN